MNEANQTLESLIKRGFIGAALGALLLKDEADGAVVGALLGAAIAATQKANETAQKMQVPVYVEEGGSLYEISHAGGKRFIKNIKTSPNNFQQQFKLK